MHHFLQLIVLHPFTRIQSVKLLHVGHLQYHYEVLSLWLWFLFSSSAGSCAHLLCYDPDLWLRSRRMSGKFQGTSCLSPVVLSSSALTTPMIQCKPSVSFLNSGLVNVFCELIMINNKGYMSNSMNWQTSQFTVAVCESCICLIIIIYVWMSNFRQTLQSKMKCCRWLTRLFHLII